MTCNNTFPSLQFFCVLGPSGIFGMLHHILTWLLLCVCVFYSILGFTTISASVLALRYSSILSENPEVGTIPNTPVYMAIGLGVVSMLLAFVGFSAAETKVMSRAR